MRQACRLPAEFVAGKTFVVYSADALLRSAVERQLTIVGEALNRLNKIDPAAASSITHARQIIAFRNILVHGSDMVRDEAVWGILQARGHGFSAVPAAGPGPIRVRQAFEPDSARSGPIRVRRESLTYFRSASGRTA